MSREISDLLGGADPVVCLTAHGGVLLLLMLCVLAWTGCFTWFVPLYAAAVIGLAASMIVPALWWFIWSSMG